MATTPTRRANRERVYASEYSDSIIADNVDFLRNIMSDTPSTMYIGGLMGCKGDAYTGEGALNTTEAFHFHSWQAQLFKDAQVDFLYAGIIPTLPEAIGMAMAMAETKILYIISFTIRRDGCLIDGSSIHDAINTIDNNVFEPPLCYMTNCVHPSIVQALKKEFGLKLFGGCCGTDNHYMKEIAQRIIL